MLTVFTAANRKYEPFVLPYIASALAHNPDTVVEIALEDAARFEQENAEALSIIAAHCGNRYLLRDGDFSKMPANSVRFIETPAHRSDYVYIGDIDILVLEEIAPIHLANMERTGLPYSNVLRPGQPRLTGLHFSHWDAFYPQPVIDESPNRDEYFLYALIAARGLPLPDPSEDFRPGHGFHLSLNRDPRVAGRGAPWGGVRDPDMAVRFAQLRGSELWRSLSPQLDGRYKRVLFVLEAMLAASFPEIMAQSEPTPELSLKW